MEYPVKLTRDDNGSLMVTFPHFPDAITFGDDMEDAVFHAQNALSEVIAARIAHREEIPRPGRKKGTAYVAIDAVTTAKLLLYWEMQEQGIKKAALARKLACDQKQIDRLLDVTHNSRIEQLDRGFAALGKRLVVDCVSINPQH